MFMSPLFEAGWLIASHALAAIMAILLGAVQLWAPKGTINHKVAGYFWIGLMAYIALSSLFISTIKTFGRFSPIHLLSLFTIAALVMVIFTIRRKKITRHRRQMKSMYFLALLITAGFTLLPGRIMHQVLFGG